MPDNLVSKMLNFSLILPKIEIFEIQFINMIPTPFKSQTTPWRVQIPASYFIDKKRKAKYFKTLLEAKEFCRKCKRFGIPTMLAEEIDNNQEESFEPLIAAAIRDLGGNAGRLWEAISYFKRTRMNITPTTVREAVEEFCKLRQTQISLRAWRQDKSRLIPLAEVAELTGIHWQTLRRGAIDGTIPGGRQIAKGKRIFFERLALNAWWEKFNREALAR